MDNDTAFDDFSHRVNEIRVESRAAANAIRALQERIQILETDKENLQNHIDFLIQNHPDPQKMQSQSMDSGRESHSKKQTNYKLIDNLEILLSKAEFLEKELRRKEQQFFIDKENWNLERKTMQKDIAQLRARVKEGKERKEGKEGRDLLARSLKKEDKVRNDAKKNPEKRKKTDAKAFTDRPVELLELESPDPPQDMQLSLMYEDKIFHLTQKLKDSELQRLQTEELLQKSRMSYSNTLEALEYEIKSLKQSAGPEVYLKEIDSLKKIVKEQNNDIQRLTFELEDWKVNYQKLEELSQFLKNAPPKFEIKQRPIKELENNVERLGLKYKELLSRTRRQDENYPELRNELRQTAFDLEYQSFLLYQQRKNEEGGLSVENN